MLKSITINNYLSFGEDVKIDFLDREGKPVNVMAFIGKNSSGKTNILKAIKFISKFITDSFHNNKPENLITTEINKFKNNYPNFEIEFIINNKNYKYILRVFQLVNKEELYINNENIFSIEVNRLNNERFNKLKELQLNKNLEAIINEVIEKTPYLININKNYKELEKRIDLNRFNTSFISTLANTNSKELIEVYNYFKKIDEFNYNDNILTLLKDEKFINFVLDKEKKILPLLQLADSDINYYKPYILKIGENAFHAIDFSKNNIKFNLTEMSAGVITLLKLIKQIFPTLENGGIFIVDELERELHPSLYKAIIELFRGTKAQLLFTTHNLLFLDHLTKDEITVLQKENNETYINHLKNLKPFNKDKFNFMREFLTGMYDKEVDEKPNFDFLEE